MTDPRPSFDDYFMGIAWSVAKRADCTRRQAGAVIVIDNRIIATGYNGAPSGDPGCLSAGACPRGQLTYDELKAHTSYDEGPGFCIATHAEVNALLHAGQSCRGATLYCVPGRPCVGCWRSMKAAGIERVVWTSFNDEQGGEWSRAQEKSNEIAEAFHRARANYMTLGGVVNEYYNTQGKKVL